MGVVEAIYKFKYFIFCRQKNTGKMARAQGKHREFGIKWSVVTLFPKYQNDTTSLVFSTI